MPAKYDIIPNMKQKILPLMGLMVVLAGCQSSSDEVIVEQPSFADACAGESCAVIRYSSPNGNDLLLETQKHVIQIAAQNDTPYSYYVWTGGKTTADDPDLIVEDGAAMVLVEE